MSVSFEECCAILNQFRPAFPQFLLRQEVHGVQVVEMDGKPVVVVLLLNSIDEKTLLPDERLPKDFVYEYQDKKLPIAVTTAVEPIARARATRRPRAIDTRREPLKGDSATDRAVPDDELLDREHPRVLSHPGDPSSGAMLAGFGTLGWNFYLNGSLVCLSNWHVFCALGNATPLGSPIFVNGTHEADLYSFQPLNVAENFWDFALGRYLNPADAAGTMRQCDDGGTLAYPARLSPKDSVNVGDGAVYYKVGARGPTCRKGTLVGVGDRSVKYDDGIIRLFKRQLIFSKMTDAGDSGAVIVREGDTTVTGLNFAGNSEATIANPIFLAGWLQTGSIQFGSNAAIPMFEGEIPRNPSPTGPEIDTTRTTSQFRERIAAYSHSIIPDDIPSLTAGKVFMALAVRGRKRQVLGGAEVWVTPPPPPVHSGVSVDVVFIRRDTKHSPSAVSVHPDFDYVDYFLCFG